MSILALAVAAMVVASPANAPMPPRLHDWGAKPTINLSAIRNIDCGRSYATGFMIADNTIATAYHVVNNKQCRDAETGEPLRVYHMEREHDFALARVEIKNMPYLTYDCSRYKTGKAYASYGYSSYLQPRRIFRQSHMIAYAGYSGPGFNVKPIGELPRLRALFGPMVFGHSGGPVADTENGNILGMNNVGLTNGFGLMTGHTYSTELADTILCRPPKKEGTSPS